MPPQCISSLPHEDWVAAVSCGIPGYVKFRASSHEPELIVCSHFLTAGYDGIIRAFDYSQKPALSGTVHNGPITSLAVVGKTAEDGSSMLLTGSHDMTAKLVRAVLPSTGDVSATLVPLAALHLHTAPVSSVAASESGERLLTSSWDMLIGVWDASIPTHDEVPMPDGGAERKKRRKVAREEPVQRKGPLAVLKSHTARVSRAVFGASGTSAYSCGLDSTVRMWDVENGVCTNTIVSGC
jgi:ribosome biogenesis protein YTM1